MAPIVIVAFYDTVDSPAPDDASFIEITDAEWQSAVTSQPPYTVVGGALTPPTSAALLSVAQSNQTGALSQTCSLAIASELFVVRAWVRVHIP